MSSILTNTGAMIALQSLTATQTALNQTENQISTGLKVQTAKDDAAAWTVATTMKANIASLGQVSTNLGNADSVLGTAVSGANQIASLISEIRLKVTAVAGDPTTSVSATQGEVDQLMNQISATIQSSSFNGVNLLDGSVTSHISNGTNGVSFLAATANDYTQAGAASSTIEVSTANSNLTTTTTAGSATTTAMGALFNLVDSAGAGGGTYSYTTTSGTTTTTTSTSMAAGLSGLVAAVQNSPSMLNSFLKTIDAATSQVETASAQFGAVQQNIEAQQTFVSNLSDSLTTGVSNLVDANMTAASARLSALQTQQQLGTQALSIANQAPQMILKLFG